MTVIVQPVDSPVAGHDARVLLGAANRLADPGVAALVRVLAASLGSGVVLSGGDEWVTPSQAGDLLHVSRQYVDKLIASGRLRATTKPGSTHRLVAVADIMELERRRRAGNAEVAALVGDMVDSGLEY